MEKSLNDLFYRIILLNELGGNAKAALRFSDPDGIRSGKSGWSFGLCQFDTQNNSQALTCLRVCGFTETEIKGIVNQTVDPRPWAGRLDPAIVTTYDTAQLAYCLNKALDFDTQFGIPVQSPDGILAGADYINQYGSEGNGAVIYYKALGRPVTALDVLNFKLTCTKYGKDHPGDCNRRYSNIVKVLNA